MALKEGWLNRQFDQVSKNVGTWPDWMKRAAGFESEGERTGPEQPAAQPNRDDLPKGQRKLELK